MSLVGFKAQNHPQQVGKRGATERDNLGTDPALFAALDERFHFDLDEHVEPHRDRECSSLRVEFLRGRQRFVLPGADAIGPNERPSLWLLPPGLGACGVNLSHLVACLNRQCVPKSLHEDVRIERDATLFALKFALETLQERDEEIRQLRALAGAPISMEGEKS